MKLLPLKCPARSSVTWLIPPATGLLWHATQDAWLNNGPTPSATVSTSSKISLFASNTAWVVWPFVWLSKPVGASVVAAIQAIGATPKARIMVISDRTRIDLIVGLQFRRLE